MKKNKITVTIGIPVYNEAQNIGYLLQSIRKQKCLSFGLTKILIISDGSSDTTADIVKAWQSKYPIISIKVYKKRRGKTVRLNELYRLNENDFLFTLDGDVVLKTSLEIEKLLGVARKTKAQVIAAHQIPCKVTGFVARILYANHSLWTEVRTPIAGGNHILNLQGSATLVSRDFADHLVYPVGITCDQAYLYVKAKAKNTFAFSPTNQVIYHPLGSFGDWNRLNKRILTEHHTLQIIFGEHITALYDTPSYYRLRALLIQLYKDPFFTLLAYGANLIFKFIIPFQKPNVTGLWPTLTSTKTAISPKMTSVI